jgi:hypothetical protein
MQDKTSLQNKLLELKAELHKLNVEVSAKKLCCNGTFGKLGSMFSAFYSPDLMLAVTMTGQLNLLSLIYYIEFNPEIKVVSANTDGITVYYPKRLRERILKAIEANAKRTGFEYEETPYRTIAYKDVNSYIAVTTSGKVKRKGLYSSPSLMKNPTMTVCSDMAAEYLKTGTHPAVEIDKHTNIGDFVAIRAVKGGGVVYAKTIEVDDWVCTKDLGTKDNEWMRQAWLDQGLIKAPVKRKSRPAPVQVGVDGVPFGRVARWYMSTKGRPINYIGSGNKVPKTDGAMLCMTLPDGLPDDLDRDWYVNETLRILADIGVDVAKTDVTV